MPLSERHQIALRYLDCPFGLVVIDSCLEQLGRRLAVKVAAEYAELFHILVVDLRLPQALALLKHRSRLMYHYDSSE